MHHHVSITLLSVTVVFMLVALFFRWANSDAIEQPIAHDGIGGKDTNNIMAFLGGIFMYVVFGLMSAVFFVLSIIVFSIGY